MESFNENEFKKFGDYVENEMLKIIRRKYPLAYNVNIDGVKNKDCDINVPEIIKTFEIKADYASAGYGNVVVEVVGPHGELSGLSTTKSDYWCFVTGFRKIWITPFELYRLLETRPESHRGRETMKGKGDNYTKLAYKVKHDYLVLYITTVLADKKRGYVEIINDATDPLFWFNCLEINTELIPYIEGAEKIMKSLNINYKIDEKYNKESSGI
jgi:hypothetical protein